MSVLTPINAERLATDGLVRTTLRIWNIFSPSGSFSAADLEFIYAIRATLSASQKEFIAA